MFNDDGGDVKDSMREFRFGLLVGMLVASIISVTAYGWLAIISVLVTGFTLLLCIPYVTWHITTSWLHAHREYERQLKYSCFQRTRTSEHARSQRIAQADHLTVVRDDEP